MRDVLAIAAVLAFFALGAAYIVASAHILSGTGDIDEAVPEEPESELDHAA